MSAKKKLVLLAALSAMFVLATAAAAFAAPAIPVGFGWIDYHPSNPGFCLGCHTGFAAGTPPAINAGVAPTHRDRGATCTQCHVVNTPDVTAPSTVSDAKASYTASATVKLTATDNAGGSGVASTHRKLDGGADTVGTAVSTSVLGAHTLEFWSVDKAANIETPHKTVSFLVEAAPPVPDTTAPVTTSDAKASYVSSAVIKLTATDNAGGSGVADTWSVLDGGAPVAGTLVSVATTGTHTLEFWSVDASGNVEIHHTVPFAVTDPPAVGTDTVQPHTRCDVRSRYVGRAIIHLRAGDVGSGVAMVYYSLDGGPKHPGTTITVIRPGRHRLVYWAVDKAGNIERHHVVVFTVVRSDDHEAGSRD